MQVDAALIGGTGIGSRLAQLPGSAVHVPTPFGTVRGRLVDQAGLKIVVFSRHSAGHKTPPHLVNYKGLGSAVRQIGAQFCFSTAAVGSLREDWPAGTFALCHDFVDISARNVTLFDREVVHTDFTEPFSNLARSFVRSAAKDLQIQLSEPCTYINGPGPRYETPHEIKLFRSIGDVVGMTAGSEACAMRESGVEYACLAIVTNLAAGLLSTPLSHQEVVEEMDRSGEKAVRILLRAVEFANGNGRA